MKRIWIPFFLAVLILSSILASTSLMASSEVKVFLDEKQLAFEVQPKIVKGRVLVPLRAIFEALGAEVNWEAAKQTITATRDGDTIQVTVNEKTAYRNGQAISLDVPPAVTDGRTLVPLRFVSESLAAAVDWEEATGTVFIKDQAGNLPVVGSYENLKTLLASAQNYGAAGQRNAMKAGAAAPEAMASAPAAAAASDSAGGYSTTNIQVQGVDEADIVKTDGEYIYQVNNRRVVIAKAYPAEEMKITSILKFDGAEQFTPRELYVDGKYLVVIGSTYRNAPVPLPAPSLIREVYPPYYSRGTVKAIIYDLSDKASLKQLREVELEGNYVSSRKIGSALYLVANKNVDYHIMDRETENLTPSYRDSAGSGEFTSISYSNIRYFPGSVVPNYLLVAGLNLERPEEKVEVSTYLGAGGNIYASIENLYVAVTRQEMTGAQPVPGAALAPQLLRPIPATESKTVVYKFALDQGLVRYKGKGEVPGTVLNQFSMDEHKGYFRIATTQGQAWRSDEDTSRNNVYILDETLKMAGRLENIAPGEKIYSARFMGDRGYMVTFRTVDPLFVMDLKDPQAPRILGALKIPGYSDYLHPYDENHIIGFGKDTMEVAPKDGQGNSGGSMAFYQGMKMALFDVSDVQNPVQKFAEMIGDRGTDSELLRNHKALLFDKDKNLLAFPVTVMEIKDKSSLSKTGVPQYGEFAFQGAYVYKINLANGFTLQGRVTHLAEEDYLKAGRYWQGSDKNVERVIYIGDTLYTLSKNMIKANELTTLKERNSLLIPK